MFETNAQGRFSNGIRNVVDIPIHGADGPNHQTVTVKLVTFHELVDSEEHFAVCFPGFDGGHIYNVRIHSECMTGDVFASLKCDCGEQLQLTIAEFSRNGGCILYLRQEGRGIGLYNKMDAYALQAKGMDTFEANAHLGFPHDARNYKAAVQMLKSMNMRRIRLFTNNPDKRAQLEADEIDVVERVSVAPKATVHSAKYLIAKRRSGHLLDQEIVV